MNKLIGYTEIIVSDGVIPIKVASYALEKLSEDFGIELEQLGELIQSREVEIDGKSQISFVPKNPIRFLATVLYNGANYVSLVNGGKSYTIGDGYRWVDELGFASPEAIRVLVLFINSIRNAGTPESAQQPAAKTSKKKAPDMVNPS